MGHAQGREENQSGGWPSRLASWSNPSSRVQAHTRTLSSDQPTRLTGALEGRYAIERELGRGGMATVYLASDSRHDRQVALKVLHPELSAGLGPERFLREIKVAARLNHPHILSLFDSGEAAGFLYYVMPYVDGESLRVRLDREQPSRRLGRDRDCPRGGLGSGVRPRMRRGASGHQARQRHAPPGRGDGDRLRDRQGVRRQWAGDPRRRPA